MWAIEHTSSAYVRERPSTLVLADRGIIWNDTKELRWKAILAVTTMPGHALLFTCLFIT